MTVLEDTLEHTRASKDTEAGIGHGVDRTRKEDPSKTNTRYLAEVGALQRK